MENTVKNKSCRLCNQKSSEKSKYLNIFEDNDQSLLKISSILDQHFWFTVHKDDGKSELICEDCWSIIYKFHTLYVKIYNDDIYLEQKDVVEVKLETTVSDSEDFLHDVSENNPLGEISRELKRDDDQDQELSVKVKEEIGSDFDEYCPSDEDPDTSSESNDQMCSQENVDMDRSGGSTTQHAKRKRTENQGGRRGAKPILTNEQLSQYVKFECDLCSFKFDSFYGANMHYKQEHNTKGYLVCCGRKFHKRVFVARHVQWHFNPESFKCDICGNCFSTPQSLNYHKLRHVPEEERTFKCPHCENVTFARQSQLNYHIKRHGERNEMCQTCGLKFKDKHNLKNHIRQVHEKANTSICDICARVFTAQHSLDNHIKLEHSAEKPARVQCKLCGAWQKNTASLRSHMGRHKEEGKLYACEICGKTAPNRAALRSHQRYVHLSDRSHSCEICGKGFKRLFELKDHVNRHTEAVQYPCPFCDMKFNSKIYMHTHKRKVHPIEWAESCKQSQMP